MTSTATTPPGRATAGRRLGAAASSQWQAASAPERAVAVAVVALGVAVDPALQQLFGHVVVLFALGAAGLPVLALRALGRGGQAAPLTWAARIAVAFAAAGLASALLSERPAVALFGLLIQQTGWLFTLAVLGCWAIGTAVSERGRPLIESTLVLVAAVQGVVALVQELWGASAWGNYVNRPAGLVGNPVFLGMLLTGGLVIAAGRFRDDPRRWWLAVAVIGVGIGVCGQRLPVVAAVVLIAVELWLGFRARRAPSVPAADGDGFGVRLSAVAPDLRRRGAAFGALVVVTVAAGTALDSIRQLGVVNYQLNSTAEGTYGDRFDAWKAAVHAIAHKPLLGAGPSMFEAATSRYFSVAFAVRNPDAEFIDAHNFLVEYATTTGVVGILLLLALLVVHARYGWGRLLGYAAAVLGIGLLEPLNVVVTPLAFLALGAALRHGLATGRHAVAPADRRRRLGLRGGRVLGTAATVLAVCGAAGGSVLLAGEAFLQGATTTSVAQVGPGPALSDARHAEDLLGWWAEPASALAGLHAYLALGGKPAERAATLYWAGEAARREPFDPYLWMDLAGEASRFGTSAQVDAAVARALDDAPHTFGAMNIAGLDALTHHDRAGALVWFRRSLAIDPSQPDVELVLSGRCADLVLAYQTGRCQGR